MVAAYDSALADGFGNKIRGKMSLKDRLAILRIMGNPFFKNDSFIAPALQQWNSKLAGKSTYECRVCGKYLGPK